MIKEMLDANLIFEVTDSTEFCSPGRFLPKKDTEKVRPVVDYRSVNEILERPAFVIMTPYEVKSSIQEDWNVFSLLVLMTLPRKES